MGVRWMMILLAMGLAAIRADAAEVDGVQLPDTAAVAGRTLVLNGAGMRTKFFFDIYVGSLYLPKRTHSAKEALAMEGPKRVRMDIRYREVDRERLNDGWREGFEKNQSPEMMKALRARLADFQALFPDLHEGDVVLLDMIPTRGVVVTINGRRAGMIPGDDFSRALLAVWLGEKPAQKSLKRAMLGLD